MAEPGRRRVWMVVLGAVVLVVLIGAAMILWVAGTNRSGDNVASFARAPVGCDTTLDFERSGEFVLYVETSGRLDQLAGECDADMRYGRDAGDVPEPGLTLLDPNGDELDLQSTDGVTYDVGGFVGSSYQTVQIDTPGDHILTVAATGGDAFAVAIGHSPDDGVALLRWGAIAALIAGLVIGGLLLVLGSRRSPAAVAPSAPWMPDATAWPSSPPGFPVPPPTTGASGPGLMIPSSPPAARPMAPTRSPWDPPSPSA